MQHHAGEGDARALLTCSYRFRLSGLVTPGRDVQQKL